MIRIEFHGPIQIACKSKVPSRILYLIFSNKKIVTDEWMNFNIGNTFFWKRDFHQNFGYPICTSHDRKVFKYLLHLHRIISWYLSVKFKKIIKYEFTIQRILEIRRLSFLSEFTLLIILALGLKIKLKFRMIWNAIGANWIVPKQKWLGSNMHVFSCCVSWM